MKAAHKLVLAESGQVVVPHLEVANTYWSRLCGLQFRKLLPADRAVLMERCSSIHTFWMRFSIDVIMLDRDGRVVEIRESVSPWRVVIPKSKTVTSILEVTAGMNPLKVGDQVRTVLTEA